MSVKISELPILDSLADNDIVAGVDVSGNVTSKIEMGTLKNYIDTNTQYTAGTNIDITNNVVSAPNVYNKDEMDSQIEELQSEVDSLSTIFNAFPTESGEGESLTLDDTAEVKFKKFDLKGNTSQVAYTGKNLIPAIHSFTTSGITWTKNDNGITNISGTTTGGVNVYETSVANTPIKAGTYTFNATVTGTVPANSSQVILQFNDGTLSILNLWSPSARTLTFENDTTIKNYYFYANSNMTFNASIAVQLEAGSSATTYEQYIGGKPSPRPDYPQRVEVVSGDNKILVRGKQLWDENWHLGGIGSTGGDYDATTTSIRTQSYIEIEGGKTFFVKCPLGNACYCFFYDKNKKYVTSQTVWIDATTKYGTYTMPVNATYLRVAFKSDYGATYNNDIIIGYYSSGVSTTYEPYSGNTYNIDLPVENLFDKDNANKLDCLLNGTNGNIANYNSAKSLYIPIQSSKTYTISKVLSARFVVGTCVSTPANGVICGVYSANNTGTSITITSGASDKFLCVFYYLSGTDTLTEQQILDSIQIEQGSKANSYTPYGTTPIELCSSPDGTLKDYFLHDKTTGYWYKYALINKIIYNGNETGWVKSDAQGGHYIFFRNRPSDSNPAYTTLSNYFTYNSQYGIADNSMYIGNNNIIFSRPIVNGSYIDNLDDFKDWVSKNNILVSYQLATPTTTQITYQPLIDQLNLLEKAMSKEGQTNISQINNDKPFIITAEAIKDLSSVLDRIELLES